MVSDPALQQTAFSMQFQEFHVNPITGDDVADGTSTHPFRTITHALGQIAGGIVILRLDIGVYSVESGEIFPLVIPPQTSLLGNTRSRQRPRQLDASNEKNSSSQDHPPSSLFENRILIQGGGTYDSPISGKQNVAIVLQENALLRDLTITNPNVQGTGVWIEAGAAGVSSCQVHRCGREGVLVTGLGNPVIADCGFEENTASGLTFMRYARGEVRRSVGRGNRFGLVVSDAAAPLIIESQWIENRSGIVLSGSASPVLRENRIAQNQEDGLAVFHRADPDLGHKFDPAKNSFTQNGKADLRNATKRSLTSVGNNLTLPGIHGAVHLLPSHAAVLQATDAVAVSSLLRRKRSPLGAKLHPVTPPPGTAPSPMPTLSALPPDVKSHWVAPFIHALRAEQAIEVSLQEPFYPNAPLSRAQFAAWLTRYFPDAPLQGEQITNSDIPLNRIQSVLMLVQGLGLEGTNPDDLLVYGDRAQIPSGAVMAVAAATHHRLVVLDSATGNGIPLRFEPFAYLTQAEATAMLYQGLVYGQRAKPIASAHIVQPQQTVAFSDSYDHWAADFIQAAVCQNLLGGFPNGQFEPDRPMSRAEYAEVLVRLFEPEAERPAVIFNDVDEREGDGTKKQLIDRVYQGKLMGGFADGSFRPNQSITRVQVLLSLVKGLRCPGADLQLLHRYVDQATIPDGAGPAMAAATASWLVVNYPRLTRLQPNRAATRAEVAAMVYQASVRLGRSTPLASPYLINPNNPSQHYQFRSPIVVVLDPGHGGQDFGVVSAELIQTEHQESSADLEDLSEFTSPLPPGFSLDFPLQPAMPIPPSVPRGESPLQLPPGMMASSRGVPPGMISPPSKLSPPIFREKDIVLSIAQKVAEHLKTKGIQVVLTRPDDRFLDLNHRIQSIHQSDADLLISLHINGAPNQPNINGLETYYYSDSRDPNAAESAQLAQALHRTILSSIDIPDRGIHPAHFYLLRTAALPAAHLELGYLTGKIDGPNLMRPDYCLHLAETIAQGILQFVFGVDPRWRSPS